MPASTLFFWSECISKAHTKPVLAKSMHSGPSFVACLNQKQRSIFVVFECNHSLIHTHFIIWLVHSFPRGTQVCEERSNFVQAVIDCVVIIIEMKILQNEILLNMPQPGISTKPTGDKCWIASCLNIATSEQATLYDCWHFQTSKFNCKQLRTKNVDQTLMSCKRTFIQSISSSNASLLSLQFWI